MVKKRGSNKMTYRPLKNSNMIGAGKKESVEQILKKGSQAKPKNKTFVEHVKPKAKPKPPTKTQTQITLEKKANRDKKPTPTKSIEKAKPKSTPTRGR